MGRKRLNFSPDVLTIGVYALLAFSLIAGALFLKKTFGWPQEKKAVPSPSPSKNEGSVAQAQTLFAIEIPDNRVTFSFKANSSLLEALATLKLKNQSPYPLTVYKINWDMWQGNIHLKSGTSTNPMEFPKTSEQTLTIKAVLNESEINDVLWLGEKKNATIFLEGLVSGTVGGNVFSKKFTLLSLPFEIVGRPPRKHETEALPSDTDGLTGLLTRRFLENDLQNYIDKNIHRGPISFFMIDIDNFKSVNDECGHLAGDEVLKAAGAELKTAIGRNGLAVRYGGDELAAVIQNCDIREAEEIGEQIRTAIEKREFHYEEKILKVTISVGVASLTEQASCKWLIQNADNMLRYSKKNGKNRVGVNKRRVDRD